MCKIYLLLILTLTVLAADSQLKKSQVEEFLKKIPNGLRRSTAQSEEQRMLEGQLARIVGPVPIPTYEEIFILNMPKFVPSIRFIGQGYNIFRGNPKSTRGVDPGFTNHNLLATYVYASPYESLMRDYSHFVPYGYSASQMQACSISYSSKGVTSMSQYTDTLTVSASVSGGIGKAAFSASSEYKSTASGLSSQESLFVESSAKCTVFAVSLYEGVEYGPYFSGYGQETLRLLEEQGENAEAYYDFFDEVGTHIVDSAELGSQQGYIFEMSVTETKKLLSQSVNVEAAASYLAVSGSAKSSYEKSQEESFKSAVSSWKSYSIGATPDGENDSLKWAAQSISNPMPVKINLIDFSIFLKNYFSADKMGVTQTAFDNLMNRFKKYADSYCQDRMVRRGVIATCSPQNIQAPINLASVTNYNFVEQLAVDQAQVNLIQKTSGKFLAARTSDARIIIDRYFGQNLQKFTLTLIDKVEQIYLIKNSQTQQCIALSECNNANSYITYKNCSTTDPCQRMKIIMFDASKKEITIFATKLNNRIMMTQGYEGYAGNVAQFWINDNPTDARVWKLIAAL